jgi:hypothetical protein
VGLDLGAARERVRVARALGDLPLLSAALARGELSYSKVRALTRVATPETETRLLAVGRAGTAAHVEKIVQGWRRVDRQIETREAKARHQALQVYTDEDGMVVVRGRLSPEAGAVLVRALDAAREVLYKGARALGNPGQGPVADPPTPGQQRADALALVAETALEHGLGADPRSERYQVVVHVDAAALADPGQPGQSVLEDGARVSAETSRRLARPPASSCVTRATAQCSTWGDGPGRSRRPSAGHWRRGTAAVASQAAASVTPKGITSSTGPTGGRPGSPTSRSSAAATNRAQRLAIDAWTACPSWLGERLDLGWAIDVLHPACNPTVPRPQARWDSPADRIFMSTPWWKSTPWWMTASVGDD